VEKDPFQNIPFPSPCSKREKGEEEKDTKLNDVAESEPRNCLSECELLIVEGDE
jgi:hypothetical protein